MKITNPLAIEEILNELLEPEIANETEPQTEPQTEPIFVPLSLDAYIERERQIVVETLNGKDRDTVIKYCEVVEPEEFENAESYRKEAYRKSGTNTSYSSWCAIHPLEQYMPSAPKKKRYIYHPYSEQPTEQFVYEFAFKWTAYTIRKLLRWSKGDTRVARLYCDVLRNDWFKEHSPATQDIVQEVLCTMFAELKSRAKADGEFQLRKKNPFAEQYVFATADLVGYRKNPDTSQNSIAIINCKFVHFADETDTETVELAYDLNSRYDIFSNCGKAIMAWVERNQVWIDDYNRNGKKRISLHKWVEDTVGDYRQEREIVRAEGSLDWLKRRKEILDTIGEVKPAGELRAYRAVLDLLHDGVLDFDSHETLSTWQMDMIILAICGEERKTKTQLKKIDHEKKLIPQEQVRAYNTLGVTVKKYVKYVPVNKGKCVAKNSATITYRDTEHNKIVLDLLTIKNTLFAYCRAFAE